MTTLVAVLAAHGRPYPMLVRTIKRTWASVPTPDVTTVFYYGGDRFRVDGADVYLPVSDGLPAGDKTLAFFEYALGAHDFDQLFRTNSSTYVDLPNLRAFVHREAKPTRFYCGYRGMYAMLPFAAGSGYFLSRDLVELVVEQREAWDNSLPDDIALADLMHRNGVEVAIAPRVDYTTGRAVSDVDTTQFYFRCKTESPLRLGDVRIMLKLHQAFSRARGRPFRSPFLGASSVLAKAYSGWVRVREAALRG